MRGNLSQEFREWWEGLEVGTRLQFRGRSSNQAAVNEMLGRGANKSTRDMFNTVLRREYVPVGMARLVQKGAGGSRDRNKATIWERTEPGHSMAHVGARPEVKPAAPELSPADVGMAVMAYIDRLKGKVTNLVEEIAKGKREFGELLEEHQAVCDQLRDAKLKINELNAKLQGGQRTISLHEIQGKLLEAVKNGGV